MGLSPRTADVEFEPSEDIAVQGRGSIYTTVGEWVVLTPISDRATRLYWILRAHVNVRRTLSDGRKDERVWPTQDRLTKLLHVSKRQTVAAALDELVAIDAVTVIRERNGMRKRNVYVVHLDPPEGFDGYRSANDVVTREPAEKPAEDDATTSGSAEKPQVGPDVRGDVHRMYAGADINKTKNNKTKKDSSLPARPHADARGRNRKADASKRKTNRSRYPTHDDWIDLDDPEQMVQNILEEVDAPPGLEALLLSKITQDCDEDGWPLPSTQPTPRHLMNIALKAEKWGTVDFAYINRQEQQGRGPDDPIDQDCPFWTDTRTRGVA